MNERRISDWRSKEAPDFSPIAVLSDLLSDAGDLVSMMRVGLEGLTDEEYLWEPVDGCWSVRPRLAQRTPPNHALPAGDWGLDIQYPDPIPSPFTTIAWRMTHLIGSTYVAAALVRGTQLPSGHLDERWEQHRAVPISAAEAVARWENALDELRGRLSTADDSDMWRRESHQWDWPQKEPGSEDPVWKQVMFFGYFEPACHGAEIRCIRDLFRHTNGGSNALIPSAPAESSSR